MVFMSIFNFLEPGVTIIAQAIPMFRVLVVSVKNASNAVRISSPSAHGTSALARTWNSKSRSRRDPDEELLHVDVERPSRAVHAPGPTGSDDEWKVYDGN